MARETNIGQGAIKTIIAELIAEHGYDAVKYMIEKLRPAKKAATSGSAGAAVMLALVALGSRGRGGRRKHR